MKTLDTKVYLLFLILFQFGLFNIQAQMIKVELEEVAINSYSIIKGVVINQWSEYEEDGKKIITVTEFQVLESIKGDIKQTEHIVIPGGIVGDVGMGVSHTPQFNIGEEAIVFISNDYKGRPTVTG